MVATLAQAASAAYYLESQRSFRHPNEYYTAGEEPDGVWFNPRGLLGLENGGKVDSGDFHRLYNGFAPDGSQKLTRNAGSEQRSPGLDMTFSADKSVSALWAIADPELRGEIEQAHNDAARVALEETVFRYCAYTRIRDEEGHIQVLPADISVAMFQHGTSRENDPQLHTHCVIFNAARTHEDGKWRAMHQYPVYSWAKAAGAVYRNALAWNLRERLGVPMEQYGPDGGLTRIEGMPEDLQAFWSKRRKAIVAKAGELGIPSLGNASRMAGVNKLTRAGKSHDNDPDVRHRRWHEEAEGFAEREALIASVTGHKTEIGHEAIRELTARLDDLPAHLARQEAVFRRPDMVEAAANASAGLIGPEALKTAIERLRRNPEIERLAPKKPTAESLAGMAHTEIYSTRHNLGLEQAVKDMTAAMAADTGHGLPEEAVKEKVEALLEQGYPLSQEQSLAIRHATVRAGRVAVIEGAAGSGKTTTLRPITDLHKEHGYEIVPTAVAWRTAVALGDDCDARAYCVDKLLKLAAKEQVEIGAKTLIVVDEAGMLSTRQAHHILQLSERHGAKVVFAGDTRQQQPVEAGPGLRLIRDVARSVRVDRIRRQKADLEDVLVHVHRETPEHARFRAGLTNPQERDAILADYEAMERKPVFTPWQVAVSEALRDGEAEKAIEAWHLRNRLHLCHDEEKTLTRLVDDWERHVRTQPGTSAVVLARTKAEGRALSWLMRQRVLAQTPDAKRAVIEVSRDIDGRLTEPLEIAVGDRIRIGATQWEKQLFNGTVVTIEDLDMRPAEAAAVSDTAVSRKARNRQARGAAGRDLEPGRGDPESEISVHITARTDDGRRVEFRHDEIRDWHDNIRLDYGYAMTIASAQGLTVDRAFLLADERPARETIYPAATRHREGLDIYVNRSPLGLRYCRAPARGRGGHAGDGLGRARLSGRALVALAAQGGRARLHHRRRMAGCERRGTGRQRDWRSQTGTGRREARRCRRRAEKDGRGPRRRERQRDRAHRPRDPPRGQRLAPWRGGRRVRGGAGRGSGRVGRAARADARRGRRGGAEPGIPRDPRSPRCADEAGTTIPCQAAGVRAPVGRACRDRRARDRGVRRSACPGRQLPPLRRRQGGALPADRHGTVAGARAGGGLRRDARPPAGARRGNAATGPRGAAPRPAVPHRT